MNKDTTMDPVEQTEQGLDLGSAGCLLVYRGLERDIQVLDEGLHRWVSHFRSVRRGGWAAGEHSGRWARRLAKMLPVGEHMRLAVWRPSAQWDTRGDICSGEGNLSSSEQRQKGGSPGQQRAMAQALGLEEGF